MDPEDGGPSSIISKLQAIEDKISGNRYKGFGTTKKKRETKFQKIHTDYVLLTSSDEERDDTNDHSIKVRKRKLPSSNYADDSDYEPALSTYQPSKEDCRPKRGRGRPKKLKTGAKIEIDREKDHSLLQLTKVLSRAELRQQNETREFNSGESCNSDKAKMRRGRGRPRKIDNNAIKCKNVSSSVSCVTSQDTVETVSGIFELSAEVEVEHLLKEAELSSNALQALAFVYQDENKSFSDAAELGLSFGDTPFNAASILTPPPSAHTTPDKFGSFSHYSLNYAVSNGTKDSSISFKSPSKDKKSKSYKSLSKNQPNAFKCSNPSFTKDLKEEKPQVKSVHCMKTRRSSVTTNIESPIRISPRKDVSLQKRNLKSTSKLLKSPSSITIEKSKRKLFPIKVISNNDKPVTSYAHLIGSRQYAENSVKTCFNVDEIGKSGPEENQQVAHPIKEETEPLLNEKADTSEEQSPVQSIPIKDELVEIKTERLTVAKPIKMNTCLQRVIKEEAVLNSDSNDQSESVKVCPEKIRESEVETIFDSSALDYMTELPDSDCVKTESNELIPRNLNNACPGNQPSPVHSNTKPLASSPGHVSINEPSLSNATSPSNSKELLENGKFKRKSRSSKRALQNRNSQQPTRARGGYRAASHPTRRQLQVPPARYTCQKCGTSFKFLSTYHYHVATDCNSKAVTVQESSEVFQCPQCPKQVASRTSLMVHLRQHTGERPFQCDLCPVAFYQKHHLRDHKEKIHVNPKSFVCSYCGETSVGYKAWKGHTSLCRARQQKVDTLPCRLCGARFKTKEELDGHAGSHLGQEKPLSCPSCPRRFHYPLQLARHAPLCTASPHVCPLCGKAFTSARHLRSHQARHEGAAALGHPCAHCPARFYSSYELRMHTRLHTDERPYPCPVCLKRFRRKSTMELHHTLHTGVRPYACAECDQRFNRNVKLQIHYTQAHNKGSIFQCYHCSKTFPCKSYLIPHLRAHTGEKPYACPLCARSFTRTYQLRNHLKRNHQRSDQNPYARAFMSVGEGETDRTERNAIQDVDEDTTSVDEFNAVKENDGETSCAQETNKVIVFNVEQGTNYVESNDVQDSEDIDEDSLSVHEYNAVQEIDYENSSAEEVNKVIVLNLVQEANYGESNSFQDIHHRIQNFNGILQVSNAQDRLQNDLLTNGPQEIKDHETKEHQRFSDEQEILPD